MATPKLGNGAVLYRETTGGSPSSYTAIGNVTSIQGPSGQAPVVDATHLTSTYREKLMGLPDEGQIQITGQFIAADAQQDALRDDRTARTLREFKIVGPDSAFTLVFNAYVLTFSLSGIGVDEIVTFNTTLEISGSVAWITP